MAQKTIVQFVDDLDGTTNDSIETITFGLDGVTYEIDLSDANAGKLREELADFVGSARRIGGRAKHGTASTVARATAANRSGRSREQTQAIREWARNNGWDVAERGRIPANVVEAFETKAGNAKGRKGK
jgi:hypothetical protein